MTNVHPYPAAATIESLFVIRSATPDDAVALDALIAAHREEGHLLPRQVDEIRTRASRFLVAEFDGVIKACAELVPLSKQMAEVRSLVVSGDVRRHGLASRLIDELRKRAILEGFQSLLALAHNPLFFIRHNFSLVPHEWLSAKISRDCHNCELFRHCGQHALLLSLAVARPAPMPLPTPRRVAVA